MSINGLIKLLETEPDRFQEWYSLELNAPMDASAHHDKHHLPPLHRLI